MTITMFSFWANPRSSGAHLLASPEPLPCGDEILPWCHHSEHLCRVSGCSHSFSALSRRVHAPMEKPSGHPGGRGSRGEFAPGQVADSCKRAQPCNSYNGFLMLAARRQNSCAALSKSNADDMRMRCCPSPVQRSAVGAAGQGARPVWGHPHPAAHGRQGRPHPHARRRLPRRRAAHRLRHLPGCELGYLSISLTYLPFCLKFLRSLALNRLSTVLCHSCVHAAVSDAGARCMSQCPGALHAYHAPTSLLCREPVVQSCCILILF